MLETYNYILLFIKFLCAKLLTEYSVTGNRVFFFSSIFIGRVSVYNKIKQTNLLFTFNNTYIHNTNMCQVKPFIICLDIFQETLQEYVQPELLLCEIQSMYENSESNAHILALIQNHLRWVSDTVKGVLSQDEAKVGELSSRGNSCYLQMTYFLGTIQTRPLTCT